MATSTINNDGFEWEPNGNFPGTWATVSDSASNTVGLAPNAICVGSWFNSSSTVLSFFNAAMTFDNLVGFNGGIVADATLSLRFVSAHKYTVFRVKAVLPDTPVMSQSSLPSAQSLTATYVEINTSTLSGYDQYGVWSPPLVSVDLSAVVQEFIDHANYASGDDLTLIFEYQDNSGSGDSLTGIAGSAAGTPSSLAYTINNNYNPSITSVSDNNTVKNNENVTVLVRDLTNVTNHRIYKGAQIQNLTASAVTGGFQFPLVLATIGYGSGYTYALDSSEGTFTQVISIIADNGYAYGTVADPSIADNSIFFGADPVVIDGDQFDYSTTTIQNGDTASISAAGVPKITGSGSGYDTFNASYFNSTLKQWQAGLLVEFNDLGYFNTNKLGPVELALNAGGFIQGIGSADLPTGKLIMSASVFTSEYVENPDSGAGFTSVNKPSLKVLDAGNSLTLYANRDNTGEFQFLESGVAVDLTLCTRIELKIGNQSFSDSEFQWHEKFTKSASRGVLEVQLGELGLPPGTYKFYFVLYTAAHYHGIVWNEKDSYTLTLKDA